MSPVDQLSTAALDHLRTYISGTPAERACAFELFVVVSAGMASTSFATGDAPLRAHIDEIGRLPGAVAEVLRKHGIDTAKGKVGHIGLATFALRFVDEYARGFHDWWHPAYTQFETKFFADAPHAGALDCDLAWPLSPRCRADLRAMLGPVREFRASLARIAGIDADAVVPRPPSTPLARVALEAPLPVPPGAEPKQRMTRWLSLIEIIKVARSHRGAETGRRADLVAKRGTDFEPTHVAEVGDDGECIVDYVADLGDAFDPTMAVAWQLGRRSLQLPDDPTHELPTPPTSLRRGDTLILGGDLVYPYATADRYRNQTELPYSFAWEGPHPAKPPAVLAIPGNHDWLGGIEHFDDVFVTRTMFADTWKSPQEHRYWTIALPQGWWVWGIDTRLDDQLPPGQYRYFEAAASALRPGHRVIVCTPVPMWRLRQRDPHKFHQLSTQIEGLINGQGARAALWLSGDSHAAAVFDQPLEHTTACHVMAGGGGAFLHPSHNFAARLPLERGPIEFAKVTAWPPASESRELAGGAGTLRDPRTWSLVAVGALLQGAFLLLASNRRGAIDAIETSGRGPIPSLRWVLASPWLLVAAALVAVLGSLMVKTNSREARLRSGGKVLGTAAGAATAAVLTLVAAARHWIDPSPSGWLTALAVVGGGAVAMAAHLAGMRAINATIMANDNVTFAAAHSTRFKNFVRLRVNRDGDLTCYLIGLDPVGEQWFDALTTTALVPPPDRAGVPRLHYVWGRTFPKFDPTPIRVNISASDPIDGLEREAERTAQVADIFQRVGTRLADGGHVLVFGGLPGYGLTTIMETEHRRHLDNPNRGQHFVNYVASYQWAARHDRRDPATPIDRIEMLHIQRVGDPLESQALREARDLTAMRIALTERSVLRFCMGGPVVPAARRRAPGIFEEAFMAVELRLPLLVAGGLGGAAGLVADCILGRAEAGGIEALAGHFLSASELAEHPATDRRLQNVTFTDMVARLRGVAQLDNGLTEGENLELLTSTDPDTITELVMRSVQRIARRPRRTIPVDSARLISSSRSYEAMRSL